MPGEEAQVDWAHFGKINVGRAERPLFAFVMVLSFSRMHFVCFAMPSFLRGHVEAFRFFGAAPRVIVYDDLEERGVCVVDPETPLETLAEHRRSYDRDQRVEHEPHLRALVEVVAGGKLELRSARELTGAPARALDLRPTARRRRWRADGEP